MDSRDNKTNNSEGSIAETTTSHDAAFDYLDRGYSVIPIRPLSKCPSTEWKQYQKRRPTNAEIATWFPANRIASVGLVTGSVSGGLVDIDLDCPEACALAPSFLPPTGMIHGRKTNEKSHYWYKPSPVPDFATFESPAGEMLVEVRSDGHYTVVPPSIHQSGEPIVWHSNGRPSEVGGQALVTAARRLAACVLLARNWPKKGSRQKCALSVAGVLLRGGESEEFAKQFIASAARVAGDEEHDQRTSAVESTAQTLATNSPATGHPTLASFIGQDNADKISDWLDLDSASTAQPKLNSDQTSELLRLTSDMELFHTEERIPYATFSCKGHIETLRIDDAEFEEELVYRHLTAKTSVPSNEAVRKTLVALRAKARREGDQHKVFVRVGEHQGKLYFDLANKERKVVEIGPCGWKTLTDSPVKFERPPGLLPCPEPQRGGSLDLLRKILNVQDDPMFRLIVGWLLSTLKATGPYPIAVFKGEAGCGKTMNCRILRSLIDPAKPPMVSKPRSEQDLMIQANNSFVLCFDNLSGISNELSDLLCTLSTGAGSRVRAHYTNGGEFLIDVAKPQLVNGIDDIARRSDFLSRSVVLELPPIAPAKKRDPDELLKDFESNHGLILGALFDAMSAVLAKESTLVLPELPRMARFARRGTAAEQFLGWPPGSFLEALKSNALGANDAVLDDSPIATAIDLFVSDNGDEWKGPAGELLVLLEDYKPETAKRWPLTPTKLSSEIARIAPNLRESGIDVATGRDTTGAKKRYIKLSRGAVTNVTTVTTKEGAPVARGIPDADDMANPKSFIAPENTGSTSSDGGDARRRKYGFLNNLSERELHEFAKAELQRN